MKSQQWSVKALVSYLKLKLDNDNLIQNITVVGELSNFNHHHSNHMYFTLKDDKSRISCVMFSSYASKVKFKPKSGMKVVIKASVSIFEASGALQLYVKEMTQFGQGDLALEFEKLKKKLNEEGLFLDKHKKVISKYPMSIGIVSGKGSAALSDILTTLKRRWPIAKLKVYNSLVQGKNAHLDLINNLDIADNNNHDTIILARGGGSIEDLWPFNEELLARKIFELKTPIISGVGHEIDFTISDFVSDMRAATPTAAAEVSSPDIKDIKQLFLNLENKLEDNIVQIINQKKQHLDYIENNAVFTHPDILLNEIKNKLKKHEEALSVYANKTISRINYFNNISNKFKSVVSDFIYQQNMTLNLLKKDLDNNIDAYLNNKQHQLIKEINLIQSYSPINTLKRGYSLVKKDDTIIKSVESIKENEIVNITMQDGSFKANVLERRKNDEWFWLWKSNY